MKKLCKLKLKSCFMSRNVTVSCFTLLMNLLIGYIVIVGGVAFVMLAMKEKSKPNIPVTDEKQKLVAAETGKEEKRNKLQKAVSCAKALAAKAVDDNGLYYPAVSQTAMALFDELDKQKKAAGHKTNLDLYRIRLKNLMWYAKLVAPEKDVSVAAIQLSPTISDILRKSKLTVSLGELSQLATGIARETIAQRPKKTGLVFQGDRFDSYLKRLPNKVMKFERNKLKRLNYLKTFLCQAMCQSRYGKNTIKLNNGTVLKGKIDADISGLQVTLPNKTKRQVNWDDIDSDQIIEFMEYYTALRRKMAASQNAIKGQIKKGMAQDYLSLALYCEWIGDYKKLEKYIANAVKNDPVVIRQLERYLYNREIKHVQLAVVMNVPAKDKRSRS